MSEDKPSTPSVESNVGTEAEQPPAASPDDPVSLQTGMEPWFRVPPALLGPHCPACCAPLKRHDDKCPKCTRDRLARNQALTAAFVRQVGAANEDLTVLDVLPPTLGSRLGQDARRQAKAMLDSPQGLLTRLRTVIVGPPLSGKSTIARAFFEVAYRVARSGDGDAMARAERALALWATDITDPVGDSDLFRDARNTPWLLLDNIGLAPDPRERIRAILDDRALRGLPTICAVAIPTAEAYTARWGGNLAPLLFSPPSVLVDLGPKGLVVRK
jgi:hypothetical protein